MLLDNSETESVFSSRTSVQLFFFYDIFISKPDYFILLIHGCHIFSNKTFYVRLLRLSFFFSLNLTFVGFLNAEVN